MATREQKQESMPKEGMSIGALLYRILRYVMPYRWLVAITLFLTLVGSLLAQVNAIVLDRAVDAINVVDQQPTLSWSIALRILTIVSAVLLGKELLAAVVNFLRRYGYKISLSDDNDLRFNPQGLFLEEVD